MTAASSKVGSRMTALWAALVLAAAGCQVAAAGPRDSGKRITLPKAAASVLVMVTDRDSPPAIAAMGRLILATLHQGERIFLMDDRGGPVLASAVAPSPPSVTIPRPPAPLPGGATEYQTSLHERAVRQYRNRLTQARTHLRALEQHRLKAWAAGLLARADTNLQRADVTDGGIRPALVAALADTSSLRQAGVRIGTRVAIALLGIDGVTAHYPPQPPAGLQGATVIVDNFPGTSQEEETWRASFLRSGAARAVMLTAATDGELSLLVRHALAC